MTDAEARKQLLLTRIALERAQWTRDIGALRQVASLQRLLPGALRAALGSGWLATLFGRAPASPEYSGAPGWAGQIARALALVRRYPILWSLLGSVLPWARGRRAKGRSRPVGIAVCGALAAAAIAAWAINRLRDSPESE